MLRNRYIKKVNEEQNKAVGNDGKIEVIFESNYDYVSDSELAVESIAEYINIPEQDEVFKPNDLSAFLESGSSSHFSENSGTDYEDEVFYPQEDEVEQSVLSKLLNKMLLDDTHPLPGHSASSHFFSNINEFIKLQNDKVKKEVNEYVPPLPLLIKLASSTHEEIQDIVALKEKLAEVQNSLDEKLYVAKTREEKTNEDMKSIYNKKMVFFGQSGLAAVVDADKISKAEVNPPRFPFPGKFGQY